MTRAQNKSPGVAGPIASFRDRFAASVSAHQSLLVPGAAHALSARIIADIGFEALFLTGAGVTNMPLAWTWAGIRIDYDRQRNSIADGVGVLSHCPMAVCKTEYGELFDTILPNRVLLRRGRQDPNR